MSGNLCDYTSVNFWSHDIYNFNPMLSAVEKNITHSACNSKAELVTTINDVFEDIYRETMKNAYTGPQSSLYAVVEDERSYFQ